MQTVSVSELLSVIKDAEQTILRQHKMIDDLNNEMAALRKARETYMLHNTQLHVSVNVLAKWFVNLCRDCSCYKGDGFFTDDPIIQQAVAEHMKKENKA